MCVGVGLEVVVAREKGAAGGSQLCGAPMTISRGQFGRRVVHARLEECVECRGP